MSKIIRRALATAVVSLPMVGLVDLAAGQQLPGAQSATQTREQRQQAQNGAAQESQAQPRQVNPQSQPAAPRPAQPGQITQPAIPGQPGAVRQTVEFRAGQGQVNDQTLINAFLLGPNQAEVALGQIAQRQAQNEEVKQFAEKMVQAHGQLLQQLQGIGGAAQAQAAAQPELLQVIKDIERHCQQSATEELQKHQGAEFDQAYVGMMVMAHGKMLSTLEAVRAKASPELQQVLTQATDSTRQHYEMAHHLIKKLNDGSSATRSAALPAQPNQSQEKRN